MVGTLKGYDQLVNLVLDDCVEYLRGKLGDVKFCVDFFFIRSR